MGWSFGQSVADNPITRESRSHKLPRLLAMVAENDRVIMNRWVHIAHRHRNRIYQVEIRLKPIISAFLASSRSLAFCRISRRRNRRFSESLITRITNIPPKQIEIQSRVSANLSGAKVNAPLIFSVASVTPPRGR